MDCYFKEIATSYSGIKGIYFKEKTNNVSFQAGHGEDFCFKIHSPPFLFLAKVL